MNRLFPSEKLHRVWEAIRNVVPDALQKSITQPDQCGDDQMVSEVVQT